MRTYTSGYGKLTHQCLMRTKTAAHEKAAVDAALDEDARRHSSSLRLPYLNQDKCNEKHESQHEKRDDTPVTPLNEVSVKDPMEQSMFSGNQETPG